MKGGAQTIALSGPVVEPTGLGAIALADGYWAEIRRLTLGAARARPTAGGVELRLAGLVLFRFGVPRTTTENGRVECRFPIVGGLLAKEEAGSLAFVQHAVPTPELEVSVEDYVPFLSSSRPRRSLRNFVYRQVQERAHAASGRRYLEHMAARSR